MSNREPYDETDSNALLSEEEQDVLFEHMVAQSKLSDEQKAMVRQSYRLMKTHPEIYDELERSEDEADPEEPKP